MVLRRLKSRNVALGVSEPACVRVGAGSRQASPVQARMAWRLKPESIRRWWNPAAPLAGQRRASERHDLGAAEGRAPRRLRRGTM